MEDRSLEHVDILHDYFDDIYIQAHHLHSKVRRSAYNLPAF